tara:strand:- start:134 stop:418 length:285 start_codon:yes stop_codon:yes gene_type:complete
MWWTIIIILLIISLTSSITLYYALRRINQYEDLISQFQQIISFSTQKMKLVDSKGHYESDDETGFFFEQLRELQLLLDNIFEQDEEIKNAKKEK